MRLWAKQERISILQQVLPLTQDSIGKTRGGGGYNEENNFWLFKGNIKLILNDTIFFAFIHKATG